MLMSSLNRPTKAESVVDANSSAENSLSSSELSVSWLSPLVIKFIGGDIVTVVERLFNDRFLTTLLLVRNLLNFNLRNSFAAALVTVVIGRKMLTGEMNPFAWIADLAK